MPRNTSGVYTLPAGNPVVPGTVIDAEWANSTLEDLANEVTNSLSRTGAGGMLAPFRIADGTITTPGLSYLNETNTGLYRSGAGSTWMSVLGVNVAQFSTVGLTIPFGKALTAQGNASVAGTLAVTGATVIASTLAVTGAITASGGVVGNVTGNVTAASGSSTFNNITISGSLDMDAGSSATITGLSTPTNASDAANKGYVDSVLGSKLSLTGGTMSGAIAMGNSKITGLATPTADADAATKAYVDSTAQGLDVKASCRVATTANITLSGTQSIDGVAVVVGNRVLVKNQTTTTQNGIYVVASGAWTRPPDADTCAELAGAFTFIENGVTNYNSGWVCQTDPDGIIGIQPIEWIQFSGAGQINAGTGMTKSGNTLNVNTASSSRIVVNTDDIDLATTGVTAGTYKSVTVDAYGRVTGGSNPNTLAGYGITDAYTTSQVDTLVNAKLSLTGGTMSGAIAMGTNKITGLGDPTNPQDAATKNYIDTIFGSTTTAAASAAAAASSASSASSSASAAASSATAAAGSATSAANSYTTFNNQYLGSKSSDPTVNNTGGALVAGNLYWNSTASEMRVYTGSAWLTAYLPATGYLALTGGTLTGSLGFNGTALRITGDMTNATRANRLMFQTSTANSNTFISAIPNGSGSGSGLDVHLSGTDPENTAFGRFAVTAASVNVRSGISGTGTQLPLTFYIHNSEHARFSTGGNFLIGTTTDNGTDKLQVTGSMSLSSALRVGATPSAGTSGQVLTSGGAGAAPTWSTPASAGSYSFTASGAIASAGLPVVLNTDGTVSSVTNIAQANTTQRFSSTGASLGGAIGVAYGNGKIFIVYKDNIGNNCYGIAGTLSGTTVTWGSAVSFGAGGTCCCSYDSTNDKFVAIRNDSSNNMYAYVATVTGTTVSFGTGNNFVTGTNGNSYSGVVFDSVSGKHVVLYQNGNNAYLNSVVGTVSGTTISFGTINTFYSAGANYFNIGYGDGKILYYYNNGSTGAAFLRSATISGTTLTFGTAVQITTNGSAGCLVYVPLYGYFVAFVNGTAGLYAQIANVYGSTVATVGNYTSTGISPAYDGWVSGAYDATAQKVVVGYNVVTGTYPYLAPFNLSLTSVIAGTPYNIVAGASSWENYSLAYEPVAKKIIAGFAYPTTYNGYTAVYTTPYSTNTNWIGLSNASASSGASVSCTILGGINTSVSGLTTGSYYYVNQSGALTNSVADAVKVGRALSATSILVSGNALA